VFAITGKREEINGCVDFRSGSSYKAVRLGLIPEWMLVYRWDDSEVRNRIRFQAFSD
jgi:hypothetical protein